MAALPKAVPSLIPQPSGAPPGTLLQIGEILADQKDVKWIVESFIGGGSSGMVYLVAHHLDDHFNATSKLPHWHLRLLRLKRCVVKIGSYTDRMLAQEAYFYLTVLQQFVFMANWIRSHKLKYLPLPWGLVSLGQHTSCTNNAMYLFLLMEQYGENIDTVFRKLKRRKFSLKTICYIALRMIDALEFMHANKYAHGDVKGANILTGYFPTDKHKVFLVDFGLAYRFMDDNGNYTCDTRVFNTEVNNHQYFCYGTTMYSSIDTHCFGKMPSAKADLESLGYCLIEWAGGVLPWAKYSKLGSCIDCVSRNISTEKGMYVNKATELLKDSFRLNPVPNYLTEYMRAVQGISYHEKPDYKLLKNLFHKALKENDLEDNEIIGLDWL